MRLRTFLFVVMAMGVVYAAATLFVDNGEVLARSFHFWGGVDLPVGLALLVFLLVGMAITVMAGLTREIGLMVDRNRRKKATRRAEEVEEQYTHGLAAVLEGRREESLRHFRAVLERDSRHVNTLLKIGEVLRQQERFAEAIEYHRKAHHLNEDDTRPLYSLVEDYEAKGEIERARGVLAKIIALKKNSVSAWRKLRSLHMKEGNWRQALEAHGKVEKYRDETDPRDSADVHVGRGIRYQIAVDELASAHSREAANLLRRLLKEDPRFIPAYVRLGEAFLADGREDDAIGAWEQGFEATESPVFLAALEEHFLQREQPVAAIEALRRCVEKSARDTLPRFFLGKLYFRLEMLDDALAVLTALESRTAHAPALHYLLGQIHERRKNYREASTEFRKLIQELELLQLEYRCRACGAHAMDWTDRCSSCGAWNTFEMDFREEMSLEELGLPPAPVYTSRL
jgi:lipopolysaccharide biosynthesis regulator YciM